MHLDPHRVGVVILGIACCVGCAKPTPQQRLVGTWTGAPEVKAAVDDAVNQASGGEPVNPIAKGLAHFGGRMLAAATMSMELDLRESGVVFFRGNTDALGVAPDSDGKWEVVSANPDLIEIKLTVADEVIPAKVLFRDKNEFTLKFDAPAKTETPAAPAESATATDPSVPLDTAAKAPDLPKTKTATSIVFKRQE